jgi:glyoxylase-like metal-dependent hydrolase (beta-lactamase superfamily II)
LVNAPASITITPVRVADLLAEGERMPVYVHVIEHPDARVLVDSGMTQLHPAAADLDPRLRPLSEQDFDLAGIDIVVNTHPHFDHCGGNHLFAGRPIYVQRRELDDARSQDRPSNTMTGAYPWSHASRPSRRDAASAARCGSHSQDCLCHGTISAGRPRPPRARPGRGGVEAGRLAVTRSPVRAGEGQPAAE